MRAGLLDRRITIQRKSLTYSGSGAPIETWANLSTNRPASVSPVSGDERFSGEQHVARQQTEFRIHYSSDIADLSPLDRVIYPASHGDSDPLAATSIYDVLAVHELGRREALRIMTARRSG